MGNRMVIALGGNAIQLGNGSTAAEQREACYHTAEQLVSIIRNGYEIVLAHGNGPQVGNIILQNQISQCEKLPAMPLDTCGAMSQGMIGYWLQSALYEVFKQQGIEKETVTILTQVQVDKEDQAFQNPTKPIGSFYTKEEADKLQEEKGYTMVEDAGRGFRRVVASPKPINIIEKNVINSLLNQQVVVVATGGGGIPVTICGSHLEGVEAVIDKDFASEKLAELVDAETLLILTAVEKVAINYGKDNEQWLSELSVEEAEEYIKEKHFAPGSMLPKIEAAITFAKSKPGRKVIITSLDKANVAVEGRTGTVISA
ncbi:carbamate kinase [Bacillus sp. RG28]|uniref:Carbamate kinase n=1 Tax=Gottfriedia endophytica TaxID=2820819 RepID=A0A940NFK3_9BACI|nr:carbamate kinase [Gottfriedia endophytica]MBP0724554.1 carbamate kinase [Gottfriedia endophytica]